jgi:hypothetical protein
MVICYQSFGNYTLKMASTGYSEAFKTIAQNTSPHISEDQVFKIHHTRSIIRMIIIFYQI